MMGSLLLYFELDWNILHCFIVIASSSGRSKLEQTVSVVLPRVLDLPFALVTQWIPVTWRDERSTKKKDCRCKLWLLVSNKITRKSWALMVCDAVVLNSINPWYHSVYCVECHPNIYKHPVSVTLRPCGPGAPLSPCREKKENILAWVKGNCQVNHYSHCLGRGEEE